MTGCAARRPAPPRGLRWAGRPWRSRAVTLVELLVVMALIGAMVAVVLPVFSGGTEAMRVRDAARQVVGLLRSARSEAITRNRMREVVVDREQGRLAVADSRLAYPLPRGIAVAAGEGPQGAAVRVRFFPDGSSDGGELAVTGGARGYRVTVERLTGRIAVDEAPIASAQTL